MSAGQSAENWAPEWLPDFPTDDAMLERLDHALGTSWTYNDDGERVHHGGDYTLNELLDFMSGYDPSLAISLGTAPGLFGEDVEWAEYPFPTYHEHDVIRALIAEVRRLRSTSFRPEANMPNAEKDAAVFIRALVNAWDCCGTCAGGVLAQRDRERDARRDRERPIPPASSDGAAQ